MKYLVIGALALAMPCVTYAASMEDPPIKAPLVASTAPAPAPKPVAAKVNPKAVYAVGVTIGEAEALAKGCPQAIVDPQVKAHLLASVPSSHETLITGLVDGTRRANELVQKLELSAHDGACVLAQFMFGPDGGHARGLIIMVQG